AVVPRSQDRANARLLSRQHVAARCSEQVVPGSPQQGAVLNHHLPAYAELFGQLITTKWFGRRREDLEHSLAPERAGGASQWPSYARLADAPALLSRAEHAPRTG